MEPARLGGDSRAAKPAGAAEPLHNTELTGPAGASWAGQCSTIVHLKCCKRLGLNCDVRRGRTVTGSSGQEGQATMPCRRARRKQQGMIGKRLPCAAHECIVAPLDGAGQTRTPPDVYLLHHVAPRVGQVFCLADPD